MTPQAASKIKATLLKEGGYSNNPLDKGGPTMYGITQATARKHGYNFDMRTLPIEIATAIYYSEYWAGPKFDLIEPIDPALSERLFDWGVNSGPKVPVKYLQRILNVLNRQQKDFPDIEADGIVGNQTLNSLRAMQKRRGAEGLAVVRFMLQSQQSNFYFELAEKNETQEEFEYGWQLNRAKGI